jgi:shikimate kinase
MTGIGVSHGSITVINAMPCGIGATIGADLETRAVFTVTGDSRTVEISNDPGENTTMARICVSKAYETAGEKEPEGWSLTTESQIPISRGLKSSSAACNAILRAVMDELDFTMDPVELIRLGVTCAREAKVTVTGSFDDACGCGLGGLVMTDNRSDEILDRADIEDYDVVLYIPEFKIRKTGLPLDRLRELAPDMQKIIKYAMRRPFYAMTENGRLISAASGNDNSVAERAISLGALGAGMSGSGPAIAIVVQRDDGESMARDLGLRPDETLITKTRCGQ